MTANLMQTADIRDM